MNFELNEDEEMLKALAERFVINTYDPERRRGYQAQANGFSQDNWSLLGELGLIAAPFDVDDGGLGLDATGVATIFEALGNGLVVEPLIENILVAGRVFAAAAKPELRDAWLPQIQTGERRLALAHQEPRGRLGRLWVECQAKHNGSGVTLSGAKSLVAAGAGVDAFLVSARISGEADDAAGVEFYFVPQDAVGLRVNSWRLADGSLAASIDLDDVHVPADAKLNQGYAALEACEPLADLARVAEAIGIMRRMFDETIEYLRTREQFGTALGSFQAIQHRMVAQYAAIEQSRALINHALVSWGSDEFPRAVAGARAFVSQASVALGHEMIQFHGGMGVSDELSIGHAHKRLLVLSRWPIDPDHALDRFAGIS